MQNWNTKERLINCVEDAPAVDVVEVIRCKECIDSIYCDQFLHCTRFGRNVEEDDFCSYGG